MIDEIKRRPQVVHNSGNNEWYTPAKFIEAARNVMGAIDLDPATSEAAQRTVRATRYFTQEDDGLAQEWAGRVWMNPPYSRGLMDAFIEKLVSAFEDGAVTEAIVLVNNATDTKWFAKLYNISSAVCLPAGRIRFHTPKGGGKGVPVQGQAIAYCGRHPDRFLDAFKQFGHTLVSHRVTDGILTSVTHRRREKRHCAQCNSLFIPKRADAKHCSAACRQRAYRQRKSHRNPGARRSA